MPLKPSDMTPGDRRAPGLDNSEASDKNGKSTFAPHDIALGYIVNRKWKPIPVPYREKFPILDDWGNLEITAANVAQYFNGGPQNIGVLLGPKSNGLTDVDLDCAEAIRLAKPFLPSTGSQFGRASKPVSHLLYNIPDAPNQGSLKLVDPNIDPSKDGKTNCIIELRMGGGTKAAQTVFPGSTHESGEPVEWYHDGEVAVSSYAELKAAVTKIAAATLLVRYYPAKGSRHDAALALGGFLARAGWSVERIGDFVEIIRLVKGMGNAPGEDPTNLKRAAIDAAETYARGDKNTYGLPGLIKFFGKKTAEAVAEFLDYTEPTYPLSVELAVKLWGEPSHKGKYNCEWGEGSNKKTLNIIRGDWFDFEKNNGGGLRDLMKAVAEAQEQDPNSPAAKIHWDGEVNPLDEKWLIEELLPEVGSGLISGQTQTYKTFVALDLSAAIMNGEPFLNYPTRREGGVLFIAAEGSNSVALRQRAVIEHKYDGGKMPFAWKTVSPRLMSANAVDELTKVATETNAQMQVKFNVPLVLIIIDTIAVAAGYEKSGEENDASATQRVMSTLAKLAVRTTTFVFGVDHYGKNPETGTRGSSAKEGGADVTLALLGEKSATGTVSNPRLLLKKRKDGEVGIIYPFRTKVVEMGVNQFGRTVTSLVIEWRPGSAAPPRDMKDTWNASKVLEKIKEAFESAVQRSGFDFKPYVSETVRAIKVSALREAFATVYTPSSDDEPEKRRKARETAFRRGYGAATEKRLLLVQETEEHGLVVWEPKL
jgi:hypothetical protein